GDDRRGGVMGITHATIAQVKTLCERIVIRGRVELDHPVERVSIDDRKERGPLLKEGRDAPDELARVALPQHACPGWFGKQGVVLRAPGQRDARTLRVE